MENTSYYNTILDHLFNGQYKDAAQKLKEYAGMLSVPEEKELQAVYDFCIGKVDNTWKPNFWSRISCHLYLRNTAFRMVFNILLFFIFFIATKISFFDKYLYRFFYARYVPILIHFRFTNYISGLILANILYYYTKYSKRPKEYDSFYFLGNIGHYEHLGGRFDLGLPKVKKSLNLLISYQQEYDKELQNNDLYRKLIDMFAAQYHQFENAGLYEEAQELFTLFMDYQNKKKYHYADLFIRSVRMVISLEMLDDETLGEDSRQTRFILGESYLSKFAWRTSIFYGLFAAIKQDFQSVREHLMNAEKFYALTIVPVEIRRYHLVHALIDIEMNDTVSALHHVQRASSFLIAIYGGIYQHCDTQLFEIEILLRGLFLNPDATAIKKVSKEISKKLKKIDKTIRGSVKNACRIQVLKALLLYLLGRFNECKDIVNNVEGELWKVSKRLGLVARQFSIDPSISVDPKKNQAAIQSATDLSLVLRLVTMVNSTNLDETSQEIIKKAFMADECILTKEYTILNAIDDYQCQTIDDFTIELRFTTQDMLFKYTIKNPINNIKFDDNLQNFIKLTVVLIKAHYNNLSVISIARASAIARTTQILAHDVRTPFSLIHSLLHLLVSSDDSEEIKQIAHNHASAVERSLLSVDEMLKDIMDIGTEYNLKVTMFDLASSIETALNDSLMSAVSHRNTIDITFNYDLKHTTLMYVDILKIHRVFTNIINNAIQAMNGKGTMWFASQEVNESNKEMLKVTIGNNGPCIPPQEINKIFDAFYTKGKKKGTGLGLAITQEIIRKHEGKIWCVSNSETGTEFVFTVPQYPGSKCTTAHTLPRDSRSVLDTYNRSLPLASQEKKERMVPDPRESVFEKQIVDFVTENKRPLRLGIVDDEALYINALKQLVNKPECLKNSIVVLSFTDDISALKMLEGKKDEQPDVLICDIDLGAHSQHGFDLVAELRRRGYGQPICIHSNRNLPEDLKQTIKVGAESLIPKPMTRAHLLKFIADSLQNIAKNEWNGSGSLPFLSVTEKKGVPITTEKAIVIAIIDDDLFFLRMWKEKLLEDSSVTVLEYNNHNQFFYDLANTDVALRLRCVIVDRYLSDYDSVYNGFATACKSCGYHGPVLLSSNSIINETVTPDGFNAVIGKKPLHWDELQSLFSVSVADGVRERHW